MTPLVVWFYINIHYFPYNAHKRAAVPFVEFAKPILDSLAGIALPIDSEQPGAP